MMLWATYEDALCLIITGKAHRPRKSNQITLLERMSARGRRTAGGKYRKDHIPPGVRTQEVDEGTHYYIPDLARFMLNAFRDEWEMQAPPLDLDYLNSLQDGEHAFFSFGSAPKVRAWNETELGRRHWELVCEEIQIKQEIPVLRGMHHAGDPAKWSKIKEETEKLNRRLDAVRSEMREIDHGLVITKPRSGVHSCLPSFPSDRVDEIAEVIKAAARILFESDNVCPTAHKVWRKLQKADIPQYDMDSKAFVEGELVLIGAKELTYERFRKRWSRYGGQ